MTAEAAAGYVRYLDLINAVSRPLPPMPVANLGPLTKATRDNPQ